MSATRRHQETQPARSAASAAQEESVRPLRIPLQADASPDAGAVQPYALRADQVCDLIQCGATTLYHIVANDPTFPPARFVGSMRRWLIDEVQAWLRAQTEQRRSQK